MTDVAGPLRNEVSSAASPTSAPASARWVPWSGAALMVAGVLVLPVVAHPDIFADGFAAGAATPQWVPIHAVGVVAMIFSLLALPGLYAVHSGRFGRLGATGVAMAVVGLVVTAGVSYAEAFVFPVLAARDPGLLALDGPLLTSTPLRAASGAALGWFVGYFLIGLATLRAGVLPRGASLAFTVGPLAFAGFEGFFVPVLDVLATLLFVAGHVWLGHAVRAVGARP